ncbi:MAG: hypothetical protein IK144_10580 [Bacteroidaceae bacterium]|nr:hypothetical protein [Bacteroidaceae bacterium]
MFKLNLSKILPDFSLRKEKTDQHIHTWKNQNKAVYADFKRGIDKVAEGDFTTLYSMYDMMKNCVPLEAQSFYDWFLTLFTQNPSQLQRMMSGNVQWAGEYTEKIAQCIVNRQLWLGINLKTGKVDIYKSRQKGLLMVKSGTPVETWNRLPQNIKAHFIEQLDKLARNSKGCMLLSKLERKQLYQALSFFADIFILSHAVFLPKFLANLYDRIIEKGDTLAYCMYYYVVFDHGLIQMMEILNGILTKEDVDESGLTLVHNCIHMLVHHSMEMGTDTKASWENAVEDCNPEIWKDVMFALHKAKGKRGKKKSIRTLDEFLIGDIPTLKNTIRQFLAENTDGICLAYLLCALVRARKIEASIPYMTFHRAIEQFTERHIGHDIPQKRYGELKIFSLSTSPYGDSYKRAKRIIDKWTQIFIEVG